MASAAVEFYFHEAFRHMDLDAVEREMHHSVSVRLSEMADGITL